MLRLPRLERLERKRVASANDHDNHWKVLLRLDGFLAEKRRQSQPEDFAEVDGDERDGASWFDKESMIGCTASSVQRTRRDEGRTGERTNGCDGARVLCYDADDACGVLDGKLEGGHGDGCGAESGGNARDVYQSLEAGNERLDGKRGFEGGGEGGGA